jgi:hypothetical protein
LDGRPGSIPDAVEYLMAGLYKLWECVMYLHTVEGFKAAWDKLQTYFHHQTAILQYLKDTWMPFKEQWAGCYIN